MIAKLRCTKEKRANRYWKKGKIEKGRKYLTWWQEKCEKLAKSRGRSLIVMSVALTT